MSRPQQPSILSFFQPKSLPQHAAPPSGGSSSNTSPPAAPPLPPPSTATASQRLPSPTPPVSITTTSITLPRKIPVLPSPPSLPSQASIVPLEEHHIPALRRINSLLLPVSYPDSFYSKILDPLSSGLFSRAILWKDQADDPTAEPKVVGGVVCRLEPNHFVDPQSGRPRALPPPPPPKSKPTLNQEASTPPPPENISTPFYAIYIQSLALLSPYRSQGLAAAALDHIIASAAILPAAGASIDARTLYAHVWTENEEALRWYESRGFRREGRFPLQGYYFKLRPDTAWIMRRDIGPSALMTAATSTASSRSTTSGVASPPPLMGNNVEIKPDVVAAAVNLPPISSSSKPPPGGPPRSGPSRGLAATSASSAASSSLSFQNTRPETEWNDLPEDMVIQKPSASSSSTNLLAAPPLTGPGAQGGGGSEASSRSSSAAGGGAAGGSGGRKKDRKRAYPAAAFGQ